MSKITQYVRHLAVVAIATLLAQCAWAAVVTVDQELTFSNADLVGTDGISLGGGSYGPINLCIPASEDIPSGTALKITELSLARRDGYTDQKSVIRIGAPAVAANASDTVSVDTTDTLGGKTRLRYAFANPVRVLAGKTYPCYLLNMQTGGTLTNTCGLHVIKPMDADHKVLQQTNSDTAWTVIYEVKATVVSVGDGSPLPAQTLGFNGNCTNGSVILDDGDSVLAVAEKGTTDASKYVTGRNGNKALKIETEIRPAYNNSFPNTINANNSWTVFSAFKPVAIDGKALSIWCQGGATWQNGSGIMLTVGTDGTLNFGKYASKQASNVISGVSVDGIYDDFHVVAITCNKDAESDKYTMWVDGVKKASGGSELMACSGTFEVGALFGGAEQISGNGYSTAVGSMIDEVAAWNTLLPDDQIKAVSSKLAAACATTSTAEVTADGEIVVTSGVPQSEWGEGVEVTITGSGTATMTTIPSFKKLDLSGLTGSLVFDLSTETNIDNNLGNNVTDYTLGNVVGGKIVIKGNAIVGLTKVNNNTIALDGTTLRIEGGLVKVNSKDQAGNLKNATIELAGGRIYNYGWFESSGTMTLDVADGIETSAFTKYCSGAPAIVKKGAGKVSIEAGNTGGNFTSVKAEAGTIAFTGNPVSVSSIIAGAGSIEIPNGKTLTVGAVTGGGDVNVAGTGVLKITGEISLTGKINCEGVTLDTTTRDFSAFSGTIKIAATGAEVGAGKVKLTGTPGLVVTIGDVTETIGETGSASIVIGDVKTSGNACLFDIVFNHLTDAQNRQNGTFDYKAVSATLKYDSDPTFSALDEEGATTADTGVYIKHHPYIDGAAGTFGNLKDFTTVVVGTMSATANTQFIHFGSTSSKGLFLATTSEKDKILVASNSGTTVKEITTLTVPNSSTARHVYVITKTDSETESIFTVYLDGVKRATVPMGEKVTIGTTSHSGVQVGSSFGGGLNGGTYKAVAASDNTGVINVLRVFDYIISWDQISKLTTDYPYVAEGGLFQRTIGATADYSAENTWTKAGAETAEFTVPTSQKEGFDPSFEITASEASTLTVNASASIETATTNGGKTTFKKDGENKIAISDSFLVNNQVVVEYGALDISGALVSLRDDDCTLELNMSAYEIPMVMETTLVPLTGQIRETDKMTITLPSDANHRHLETVYEAGRRQLKITVDTLEVTIPTVSGATSAVTVNGVAVTPTEGKITVPYNSKIVVTYAAETGKHIVGDASVTVESIEEDNIDASSITTAVNVYTVAVTKVENTVVSVKIGDADPVVCTEDTVEVEHGKAFVATYTAAAGYKITSGTAEYTYSTVTQNFTEPYSTNIVVEEMTALEKLVAAIDAATEGDTVTATGDIALEAGQIIEKAVVIDLNGNTMTVVAGSTMQSFGATIVNGTVEKSGAMYVGFTADTTATISLLEGGVYVTSGELTVESGVEEKVVATTASGNLTFYYLADPVTEVTFTITDIQDHVVVTVTADGDPLDITADNQFTAPVNTSVVVTSSPAEGYEGTPASLTAFTVVGGMTQTTIAAPQITVKRILPTATVTALSKEVATAAGLDAAYAFTAGEAVEGFDDYSATFVVTFDKDIKAGSFELKGAYEADFSTGHASYDWTPMQPAEDINVGDSWVLLPLGTVTYGDVLKIGTFNCGVANKSADNDGTTMTVKLILTNGEETLPIAEQSYKLVAPKVTGPETIDQVATDNVAKVVPEAVASVNSTALVDWIKNTSGIDSVEGLKGINVNALIFNCSNESAPATAKAEADAADAILKELASKVDLTTLTTGELNEETLAKLSKEYPMATIELKDVTTDVAGEGATNTHLFKLLIELK